MAKPYIPLSASHEKIKRAKSKFDYLKSAINGFVNNKPISFRTERKGNFAYIVGRLDQLPPEDLAWEVTEAVGHLRDALDKVIVDLVELNGRGPSCVAYPFGGFDRSTGKPNPFPDGRIEQGIKKKLTPAQWALIEAQKPYPGGNDTLWAVNEIANADKHRKGLVEVRPIIQGQIGIDAIDRRWPTAVKSIHAFPADCDFILKDKERETVVVSIESGGFNQRIQSQITPAVVFGELMPVQGKNVLVTLNQQIRLAEDIVRAFKRAFF